MKRNAFAISVVWAAASLMGCSDQTHQTTTAGAQRAGSETVNVSATPATAASTGGATTSTAYDPTYGETKVKCTSKGFDKAYFTFSKKPGEDSLGDTAHLSLRTTDGTTKWTIPLTMSGRHGSNDETLLRYESAPDALTYADGRAPQQVTFLWYAARLPFVFGVKLDDKLIAAGNCR